MIIFYEKKSCLYKKMFVMYFSDYEDIDDDDDEE